MGVYLTLTRRELGTFFLSFRGYVVIALSAFLVGLSFVSLAEQLAGVSTTMPVTEVFYNTPWFWCIFLYSAPVITMRSYALEKSSGTFETLMTAPVSDLQVVLSKFSGAMIFYTIMWAPLAGSVYILRFAAHDPSLVDPGTLGSTFLGIVMLGALYMSLGGFASALSSSQIVAAMISFALGIGLFIIGFVVDSFPINKSWISDTLSFMAMHAQMGDFARGVIDTRYIVFYATLTVFFLFLTHRAVESRRWKRARPDLTNIKRVSQAGVSGFTALILWRESSRWRRSCSWPTTFREAITPASTSIPCVRPLCLRRHCVCLTV
jgi:ABC-2 type transport system permease protein